MTFYETPGFREIKCSFRRIYRFDVVIKLGPEIPLQNGHLPLTIFKLLAAE